jgi:hypothetical protein
MKVLIVTSLSDAWPYIPEMVEELSAIGVTADVFDIDRPYNSDSGKKLGLVSMLFLKMPKLRVLMKIVFLRRRVRKELSSYDVINIHCVSLIYRFLIKGLRKRGKLLIASLWGSDFLRANVFALRALGYVLRFSDVITSNNPEVLKRVASHYGSFSERFKVVRFGLRSLDKIGELRLSEGCSGSKVALGLPMDKTIITCGYNAIREQQHAIMVDALAALPTNVKSRIYAVLQMSYPDNPMYRQEIKKRLDAGSVNYLMIDKMQSFEDVCRLRLASDMAINLQVTDSLSGSIQEHIFAGSYLIVGSWLPYEVFESIGVPLHKVSNSIDITKAIENYLVVQGKRENIAPAYADALYDFSSWRTNIIKWKDLYQLGVGSRSSLIGGLMYE